MRTGWAIARDSWPVGGEGRMLLGRPSAPISMSGKTPVSPTSAGLHQLQHNQAQNPNNNVMSPPNPAPASPAAARARGRLSDLRAPASAREPSEPGSPHSSAPALSPMHGATKRASTAPSSHGHSQPQHQQHHQNNVLIRVESQRCLFYGSFSANKLLFTDPPPWADERGLPAPPPTLTDGASGS